MVMSARFMRWLADHLGDVHLVDVVAAEDRHVIGIRGLDETQVLEDGIGGPLEPLLALAAGLGGDGDVELAEAGPLAPRFADMLVEGVGPVLGEDVDLA